MREWLHKHSLIVCFGTLVIYGVILYNSSYVGVYVTYVGVPLFVVSGAIAYWSRPKSKNES